MLLSMTGYGAGQVDEGSGRLAVEIRAVNNRYLKLQCRLPDGYAAIEPRLEALVRQHVRRGSIQLNVEIKRDPSPDDYQINADLIRCYYQQLRDLQAALTDTVAIQLELLLALPGAVSEGQHGSWTAEDDWPHIQLAVQQALAGLREMRQTEGAAMARDLAAQCKEIAQSVDAIAARAPETINAYQQRLTERLNKLLAEHDVQVQPADVVREVGVFAERADISEEIVRLRSHLDQFEQIMDQEEAGAGRKLDFLIQELLRETNTIGAKANDADIARHVVHIKTCLERIREMVQNVE